MPKSKPKTKPKPAVKLNNAQKNSGVVRIIGGEMRGRKLKFTAIEGLRPTLDRIRETLFNWLAKDITGSNCLDLFAGSGALGFEAASRGAESVTLVEYSPSVSQDLKNNIELLKASNIQLVNTDAKSFLLNNQQKFDLVFVDPPFRKGLLSEVLDSIAPHLNPDALVYIEQENADTAYIPSEIWSQIKLKKTSAFSYALYQLKSLD